MMTLLLINWEKKFTKENCKLFISLEKGFPFTSCPNFWPKFVNVDSAVMRFVWCRKGFPTANGFWNQTMIVHLLATMKIWNHVTGSTFQILWMSKKIIEKEEEGYCQRKYFHFCWSGAGFFWVWEFDISEMHHQKECTLKFSF